MLQTANTINFLLPIFYFASFFAYLADFRSEAEKFGNSKRIALFLTLILHVAYLFVLTSHLHHLPVTSKSEAFTLIAFSIIFTYFLLELSTDIRGTGFIIIGIAFLFQILSTIMFKMEYEVPELFRTFPLGFHVSAATLAYSAYAISAAYGIMFLVLYKKLKSNRFDIFFQKLPNLEILEKLSFLAMFIGFILLTFAIAMGVIWLPRVISDFSYFDPKLVLTFTVWIVYGVGILLKLLGRLNGKKFLIFSILSFVFVIVSAMINVVITSSFHTFE